MTILDERYDATATEKKWQARWEEQGTNSPDLANGQRPYYQLMMFPYPSAEGLHIGNLYAFTGADIHGRFQRMQGRTVFEPMGFDAFGIHSENYALKVGGHPMRLIPQNIANFQRQMRSAGLMLDWTRQLATTDPRYYKWTQWVFLQLLEKGLAYKKKAAVNWCPFDKTVLANEQVIAGACERCGTQVEQRFLEQWFFRITDYAKRLLDNLDALDWSESTKASQRNWIGRSEGAEIIFGTAGVGRRASDESLTGHEPPTDLPHAPRPTLDVRVFTTRPDTIFGATYLVLAPEHPLVGEVTTDDQRAAVNAYLDRTAKQDLISRKISTEKTGVFTGAHAINPATHKPIPIWIADYVLMEYGTGAIMAVPAHDERDHEFARKFGLPIVEVVGGGDVANEAYSGDGVLVNSGHFNGLPAKEANARIIEALAGQGAAKAVVNYRLHDWCISRQRYWGPPIPVIYCDSCGMQAVPEKDLPVMLPDVEDFRPDDTGVSPLARHEAWYRVPCPECGAMARRETDVSDTFLDSAWYFLRYPSAGRDDVPFDAALTKRWLPVDSYIGGNEHAVLHLLYSRFVTMVLHDMGYLDFEEPYKKFRAHGMIIREGAKMSKTKGNVVNPDQYIVDWGADVFRLYLMFIGPYEEGGDFRDRSISGVKRFLDRLWSTVDAVRTDGEPDDAVMRKLHQTIKKVGDDTPRLGYNTAIAAMMEYMNTLRANERTPHRAEVEPMAQLIAPYAPHMAEELWSRFGHSESVFDSGWPIADPAMLVDDAVEIAVQVNGKMRGRITLGRTADEKAALAAAMSDASIVKFITGPPKKVVFVPGRMLNVVL